MRQSGSMVAIERLMIDNGGLCLAAFFVFEIMCEYFRGCVRGDFAS